MAVLVFSPLLLTWLGRSAETSRKPFPTAKKIEAVGLFCALSFSAWGFLVWGEGLNSPRIALLIFMLWAGLRFGVRGAALAVFWLAVLMAFLTTHYLKGLSAADVASGNYIVTLQVFLAVAAFVGLIPAIILAERDRTMAKLRDSENRYRGLTEAAFEGVCISENGIVLDMNDQGLKMFGYPRAEMIGKNIIELVALESRPVVAEAIRTGRELIYEHQTLRKDGTIFYAEAQARMVRVGDRTLRMTALHDITERKLAEQALHESEEKFSKAFRTSPDVLSIADLETGR